MKNVIVSPFMKAFHKLMMASPNTKGQAGIRFRVMTLHWARWLNEDLYDSTLEIKERQSVHTHRGLDRLKMTWEMYKDGNLISNREFTLLKKKILHDIDNCLMAKEELVLKTNSLDFRKLVANLNYPGEQNAESTIFKTDKPKRRIDPGFLGL